MLQSIRDKSQGWFAWIIVGGVCITFALWGVHSYLYSNRATDVVAKVDGNKITRQDFDRVYNQLKRQQQMQLGAKYSPSEKMNAALKQTALQSMISSILLQQAAREEGFRAGSALVEMILAKMPIFQEQGVFSKTRFEQVMDNMLTTPGQFVQELRDNIAIRQLKYGLVETSFVLPEEIQQALQLINQKRRFDYALISLNRFMTKINLPANRAKDYYQKHPDEFKLPEKVSISYLQLSVQQLMDKIHPTTKQLKQFYQENITAYTHPKKWKLAHILLAVSPSATQKERQKIKDQMNKMVKALTQGKPFADLARQFSDDQETASKGGVMPWITAPQLDSHLLGALINLHRPGDFSPVVRTNRGYEIIKLLDSRPAKTIPFSTVQNKVGQAYQQRQAEKDYSNLSDQLANITYENPQSLSKAAKQLGLKIQTTGLFTKAGGKEKITQNPKILSAAFGADVLLQGNNSEPINISDDQVVVLRILKHTPIKLKPFDQVKPKITQKLKQKIATQQLKQFSDKLLKQLNKGASLQAVAKQYRLNIQSVGYVSLKTAQVKSNILQAAFQIPRSSKKVMQIGLPSGDIALISLQGVREGGARLNTSKMKAFRKGVAADMGMLDYQLYANGLMRDAKIVKNKID